MGGGSLEPLGERRAVHGSDAARDAARLAGEEEEEEAVAVAVAVAVERGERAGRSRADLDARREGETTPGKTNRPGSPRSREAARTPRGVSLERPPPRRRRRRICAT
jgi:hypothetical protein